MVTSVSPPGVLCWEKDSCSDGLALALVHRCAKSDGEPNVEADRVRGLPLKATDLPASHPRVAGAVDASRKSSRRDRTPKFVDVRERLLGKSWAPNVGFGAKDT